MISVKDGGGDEFDAAKHSNVLTGHWYAAISVVLAFGLVHFYLK